MESETAKFRWGIEPHTANLIAFIAVVILIGVIILNGQGGVDLAVTTGLIGVLGSFRPWSAGDLLKPKQKVEIEQPPGGSVPTHEAGETGELSPDERIR